MKARRVVVTGCGAISPFGLSAAALWGGLSQGRLGIDFIRAFDASKFAVKVAGEVKELPPQMERLPRALAFAYAAAEEAANQANLASLPLPDLCGIYCGATNDFPDVHHLLKAYRGEKVEAGLSPILGSARLRLDAMATLVARRIGIADRTRTTHVIDNACASGGMIVGEAFREVRRGGLDVALAVGATSWTNLVGIALYHKLSALSMQSSPTEASRPFDAQRSGFVMAEGGGALVLESLEHARARGAEPLAEVTGYGATASAYRITDMPDDGLAQQRAMELALRDARRTPADVGYINAHGTATQQNDVVETLAIKGLLGARCKEVPISSNKSMIGHTIAAAGVLQAIACIYAIRDGVVPPTINLRNRDVDCDLDYVPNEARSHRARLAVSNSFGFGGHNCALVIEAFES